MSLTIIKNLVPQAKWTLKATYPMQAEEICIHNTANDASAVNEIAYMINNNSDTSYHFAVDDVQAVQGLPLDRNGWHAGDGLNGRGNRKSIGIEICYSKSGGPRFKQAEKNAAKLTAQLLKERGWGIDRVKKHQDYSGKYCPHRTLSETGWANFLSMVQAEMGATAPSQGGGQMSFADKAKKSLVDAGIMSDGAWDKPVTKEQVASWLFTALQKGYFGATTPAPTPAPPKPALKSVSAIAREVIDGLWGNGQDRIDRLVRAGYSASAVQAEVNRILGG